MSNEHQYIVRAPGLPRWENPISHAVVANGMCFVSGQLAVDEKGCYLEADVETEAKMAFSNFFAALSAAGFERADVVFVDVALKDIAHMSAINRLYCECFPEGRRPARTVYQVVDLPFGGKVKVMGSAVKPTP